MDILQIFFWFCKEQKIMDIVFKMYESHRPQAWHVDKPHDIHSLGYFKDMSMAEFLKESFRKNSLFDALSDLEHYNTLKRDSLIHERFMKARRKWNGFCRNNIFYVDDYVKEGDFIEYTDIFGEEIKGIVTNVPKKLGEYITIKLEDSVLNRYLPPSYEVMKINGEKKEPKFYIKRKRKIYGINKG